MPAPSSGPSPAARRPALHEGRADHLMSHEQDFRVVTFARSGHTVVSLCGDVDASIYVIFRAAVHAVLDDTDQMTFDCAAVTFMDWSGLSVIVETLDSMTARGGTVLIWRPRRPVLRLLQITGFDDLVTIAGREQHGLAVARICRRRPPRLRTFGRRGPSPSKRDQSRNIRWERIKRDWPPLSGALGVTRTTNLLIRSQMLYPLSYERVCRERSLVAVMDGCAARLVVPRRPRPRSDGSSPSSS